MSVKTLRKDLGASRIKRELKKADRGGVTTGIHKGAGKYDNGVSVAQVAFWHEFGTIKMPQRAFFRAALHDNAEKIQNKISNELGNILSGTKTAKLAFDAVGFTISEMIRNKIKRSQEWAKPLSPKYAQAREKKFPASGDRPLIRTRKLLNSITWKVKL